LLMGMSIPSIRGMAYPWRCLWRLFLQMTRTTPRRLTTRQCSHNRLTDARTFISLLFF